MFCTRVLAAAALVAGACGHASAPVTRAQPTPAATTTAPKSAPDAAPGKIGVALSVTPPDAEVVIDGTSYGKAADLGSVIELKPGLYTLVVTREGYAPYRVEFSVSDKVEMFQVRLERRK